MEIKQGQEKIIAERHYENMNITFKDATVLCKKCSNKLRKQQIIDKRVHNQRLMENTVRTPARDSLRKNIIVDDGIVIDKKTDASVLMLIINSIKINLKSIFNLYCP